MGVQGRGGSICGNRDLHKRLGNHTILRPPLEKDYASVWFYLILLPVDEVVLVPLEGVEAGPGVSQEAVVVAVVVGGGIAIAVATRVVIADVWVVVPVSVVISIITIIMMVIARSLK